MKYQAYFETVTMKDRNIRVLKSPQKDQESSYKRKTNHFGKRNTSSHRLKYKLLMDIYENKFLEILSISERHSHIYKSSTYWYFHWIVDTHIGLQQIKYKFACKICLIDVLSLIIFSKRH